MSFLNNEKYKDIITKIMFNINFEIPEKIYK